jgi:hypothetical protein
VTVTPGLDITGSSKVLAMPQTNPGGSTTIQRISRKRDGEHLHDLPNGDRHREHDRRLVRDQLTVDRRLGIARTAGDDARSLVTETRQATTPACSATATPPGRYLVAWLLVG